jgi:hypothetical protein
VQTPDTKGEKMIKHICLMMAVLMVGIVLSADAMTLLTVTSIDPGFDIRECMISYEKDKSIQNSQDIYNAGRYKGYVVGVVDTLYLEKGCLIIYDIDKICFIVAKYLKGHPKKKEETEMARAVVLNALKDNHFECPIYQQLPLEK